MSVKELLQQDLKTAMLARDSFKTDVIKGLKSAILYAEVAAGKREEGLSDEEILGVFKKESKKRAESAELYEKGGNTASAQKETAEKAIIDAYLPAQLSQDDLNKLIDEAVAAMSLQELTKQDMGKVIGAVRAKGGAEVDGAMLAKLVQSRIAN